MNTLRPVHCPRALAVVVSLVVGLALAAPAAAVEQTLTAADGATNDQFGFSVAVEDNTAVVGAPLADGGRGAVYVFARAGDGWTQTAKLTASDGAALDRLGWSVAIAGDTIVAGAPTADVGGNSNQGAAYTFAATGAGARTETAKLTASDGAAGDQLGWSVAVAGDTIVAGARGARVGGNPVQGAAYTFAAAGAGARTETAKLTASDGAAFDQLGFSVAVAGDTIVAGAPFARVGANPVQGAAYTFAATGPGARTETAKLTASDGAARDQLGNSVAVAGDTIVAGARGAGVGANPVPGAAYTFAAAGAPARTQTAKLTASDGAALDQLGNSVAVAGGTIVAGAPRARVGANPGQGAAYTFAAAGAPARTETAKLTASAGAAGDRFGSSVAASGDAVAAGAPLANVGAKPDQGSATVFFSPAPPPPPPGPGPAPPGPAASPAPEPAATPVGAQPVRPSLSGLRLVPRCVPRSPSRRVRIRMSMRLTPPGPVHIQIDRALGSRPRHGCTRARGAPGFTGRFRPVTTLARVPTGPAPAGRRRVTLNLRLAPGLYRITVSAYLDDQLTSPARRHLRVPD